MYVCIYIYDKQNLKYIIKLAYLYIGYAITHETVRRIVILWGHL